MRRSGFPHGSAVRGTQRYFSFLLQCWQFKETELKAKTMCFAICVGGSGHRFLQKRLSAQKYHHFLSLGGTILWDFL